MSKKSISRRKLTFTYHGFYSIQFKQYEKIKRNDDKKVMATLKKPISYKSVGVNIDQGNALIEKIAPLAKSTKRPGASTSLGGFGALFDLKAAGYIDPILVAATDGVGTKLKVAIEIGNLKTVGIDLVAMCVNDLICQGAEPLFFLDYYATAKLNIGDATKVIAGITTGCQLSNIALIGGETAEMPGMYRSGDFDLAGFAIGALNRGDSLPSGIMVGDTLLSLNSVGIHSNGFSLVRMIIKNLGLSWDAIAPFSKKSLGSELLKPTRIYVKPVLELKHKGMVKGLAHITGGGLTENLPRVLGKNLGARVDLNSLSIPDVFKWLFKETNISQNEALKTFNCGVGMVLVVGKDRVDKVRDILATHNEENVIIGEVTSKPGIEYTGNLPTTND